MKKISFLFFTMVGISASRAEYLPLPVMRAEYAQVKQSCLDGIMPPETNFPFAYADYCGCVAQEIIGATKKHPEWLRDSKYHAKMQPIIASAYEYCDQYTEWKTKNAQPYVKPKNKKGATK